MTQHRNPKLDNLLADLQTRYGNRIIAPAAASETVRLPSGIDALDAQLSGGFAFRKLNLVTGALGSGATSLALRTIACTQIGGGHAVYIDLAQQFDPVAAAAHGIDLNALALIRPDDPRKAVAVARDVLVNGDSSLVVLDAYDAVLDTSSADARRLQQALVTSPAALVVIAELVPTVFTTLAGVRIQLRQLASLRRGDTISGVHSRADIADARGERATMLELRFGAPA